MTEQFLHRWRWHTSKTMLSWLLSEYFSMVFTTFLSQKWGFCIINLKNTGKSDWWSYAKNIDILDWIYSHSFNFADDPHQSTSILSSHSGMSETSNKIWSAICTIRFELMRHEFICRTKEGLQLQFQNLELIIPWASELSLGFPLMHWSSSWPY